MKDSLKKVFSTSAAVVATATLILGPLSPALAASFINTAVPTNTSLTSGLVLQYSFDGTKVSGSSVTDESGNGKTGTLSAVGSVDALIVGGGGGGGRSIGGGGGAGQVTERTSISVTAQGYSIVVGAGGVALTVNGVGNSGESSTGFGFISVGGGGGGYELGNGASGASGGGGGVGSGATGGSATAGNNGGNGAGGGSANFVGGGGGGAGSVGGNGVSGVSCGNGGSGVASLYSGASVTYGGGGGGSCASGLTGGSGGSSIGGSGGVNGGAAPTNGTANTGSGGGGSWGGTATSGGSGIVIVRYATGTMTATGGTITTSGVKTIHTFTSSGTFTPTTVSASALRVPGKIGQGLSFNGTTASTTVGNVSSSVKSVAFWVKIATSTTAQSIIDLDGSTANIKIVNGVVTPGAGFTSPTVYVDGAVTTTLNNKNWHHVVVTTGTNVNASSVKLGVVGTTYFGGTLDDLRMYNRALSAAEVRRLYGLGGTSYINTAVPTNTSLTSGLVLQYSFDGTKVSGSSVTDESGNGKTGTSQGTDQVAGSSGTVDALIVGGGASGGRNSGSSGTGGGGGGQVTEHASIAVIAQAYSIVIGAEGSPPSSGQPGNNGATSTAFSFNSIGGGGGGASGGAGRNGASGGGGGGGSGGPHSGGTGSAGSNGGTGPAIVTYDSGGGGGGAGAVGGNGDTDTGYGGNGGAGVSSSYSGSALWYGAGGGGGGNFVSGGLGGSSIGGRGSYGGGGNYTSGTANRGAGGGGAYQGADTGGSGGSGIVIIRALTSAGITATGGSHTTSGSYDIWTFTADGTWTPTFPSVPTVYSKNFTRVPGKIGQAVYFNGSATSTTVGNVSSTVKSVAFWVKVATSTTAQSIIDLDGSTANIKIVNGVVTPGAGFTSPTVYVDGAVTTTLNNKNWHHVVVTTGTNVDASSVKLGVVGTTYFGGTLDDLRMYNRALSAADVKRLYGLGGTSYINVAVPTNTSLTSGRLLHYSFDGTKVSGSSVTDESGNGKTGTNSGAGSSGSVDALIVGGGGGGGGGKAGGGGGGDVVEHASIAVTAQSYSIVVDGGGARAVSISTQGSNGGSSSAFGFTSTGGGGGGSFNGLAGKNGSSGGGGGDGDGSGTAGGTALGTNGFAGGSSVGVLNTGSGGGGAGGVGSNATSGVGGNGGIGLASSYSGTSLLYGAGGGGGGGTTKGTGGSSIGGNGGTGGVSPTDGAANRGAGGGGNMAEAVYGGNGGSGIVIIRALTSAGITAPACVMGTGCLHTTSGSYDIWTATTTTTWTPTFPSVSKNLTRVPGKIGQAIKFDGSATFTSVGNVSSSVKSVAFWAKVATSTTLQSIVDMNANGGNIKVVSGTVTANGFTSPTIYVDGAVSSTLNNTNWHHVVITTGTNVNASNVSLGVASSTYFGGTLDDLRMYNRALSAAEAKRLYQLGN